MFDSKASKCPTCSTLRLRIKEKQIISRNVEEILLKADAAEHLELLEEETRLHEVVKDLNASIASAEKRGSTDVKDALQKELEETRKKLKKPAVAKADDVKTLASESVRLVKEYEHEQHRLEKLISENQKALEEHQKKKAKKL